MAVARSVKKRPFPHTRTEACVLLLVNDGLSSALLLSDRTGKHIRTVRRILADLRRRRLVTLNIWYTERGKVATWTPRVGHAYGLAVSRARAVERNTRNSQAL